MSMGHGPPSPDLRFEALAEIAVSATARVDLCRVAEGAYQGALVAIKRLHDDVADDPEFVKMFRDEVWMASSLHHENVVRVLGWGETREGPYFATEFVRGVSLARLMRTVFQTGEMFSERLVVYLASCICKGLDAAHGLRSPTGEFLNLVHRDLTPENVLVSFSGDVKITDFGLAKAKRRASRTLTGLVKGAREYMAPEQIEGRPIDRRADIFALGVMLFELFSGQRPWLARSGRDTMKLILEAPPPELGSLRQGIHAVLVSLVTRCLSKDPANRFQTAAEVDRELTQWLQLHGYHENQDHLARFVRRNSMRQMRWVERAIAGEFAQGGGPNLAAAPPVSAAEEAALGEAEAVADWPSETGITRVGDQPVSEVRPADQGWPQIEVSPTGVFGPEVPMESDDMDDVSTLIQRPGREGKPTKGRPAVAVIDNSDSLPTIPALAVHLPDGIPAAAPTRAGLGPSDVPGAGDPRAEPSLEGPASTRDHLPPSSRSSQPIAPQPSAAAPPPARQGRGASPANAVPQAAASAEPAAASVAHRVAHAGVAPQPPAPPAPPAAGPGSAGAGSQQARAAQRSAASVRPAERAGSGRAVGRPLASVTPPGPFVAQPAQGQRQPAALAVQAAPEHPESTSSPNAPTVPPTARGHGSVAPPTVRRGSSRPGPAFQRQAQALIDEVARIASRADSMAVRATEAAKRANAAAELAAEAAERAVAAAEAVTLAREACTLAKDGQVELARARMADAEQRRQQAKGR